jgi:flagellar hook-length control protein FliK
LQTALPDVLPEFDVASAASVTATGPVPEMTAATDPVDEVVPNVSAPDVTLTSADAILSANGLAAPQAARGEPRPMSSQAAVQTPVGDPGWPDDLGEQINWMLNKTIQSADIRLNPQHLGPLQVHIRMENNQMSIQFSSEHAAVRDALEAASPQLKEMLANQQITVNDVSVNTPTPGRQESSNFMAGFDRQPPSPYQQDDAPGSTRSHLISDEDDTTANISVIPSSSSRSISLYA